MPYEWIHTAPDDSGAVSFELRLWPFRSLPRRGFVWFISVTAVLIALPMIAVLGTVVLWGLLPFVALTLWGLWHGLQRSYRSGETQEILSLNDRSLNLTRHDTGRADRVWTTNSYWVRAMLRDGPVEDYLTLTDGQREIELGAFLTPEERRALCRELQRNLQIVRQAR
ncbi:DUF2244 domain-containing protein [Paracoccus sp. Z330]|uniref:DUF2244 domain-containing protein n=1 Tax=Paracoccus onchidii TaxID=3017813 RepID=A0ABT4ZFI2_9RHOB|nr:DUF2244 domain-containing protein [Paracoccus onchidii]MDB6177450.1 DUF2244 domain-containing protein [Paracoccus onchidii]